MRLYCRKLKKINQTFDTIAVNSTNFCLLYFSTYVLNALLFQRSGQWNFSILRATLWFEQKLGIICQKTCLFVEWILGAPRPISTKNCNYISTIAYWIPKVVLVEPLKLFMQNSRSKIVQKLPKKFLKLESCQVLQFSGHCEETLCHKIRKFFF